MIQQEVTAKQTTMTSAVPAGPTILVVDDFDDTRLLLRTWLQRRGFRVVEAEDGLEAVQRAVTDSPDLIIMDVEMPYLDGLDATRQIQMLQASQLR